MKFNLSGIPDLNEKREQWRGEVAAYFDDHAVCPECGKVPGSQTYGGFIIGGTDPEKFNDKNRTDCKCGWSGFVHDLVPESSLEVLA